MTVKPTKSATLLCCALGAAACATSLASNRAILRGPVASEVAEPQLESPPAADAEGCVDGRQAYTFSNSFHAYLEKLDVWSAAQNGWHVPPASQVHRRKIRGGPRTDVYVVNDGLQLRPEQDWTDETDRRWTFIGATGTGSCGGVEDGWLYADRSHAFFTVNFERRCERTVKLKICGVMAAGGCGRPPMVRGHTWFINAPEGGAVIVGHKQQLKVEVPVCYSFHPTEGFDHPP